MIGGFFDRHHAGWDEAELAWFEALLDEDDVDVMAWALKAQPAPERFAGPLLQALERLDYVTL
jgi:antitoxin CptB